MAVNVSDFETPDKPDFPRANGAPMVLVGEKRIRMSRPSNFAKPLDDESALTNWRIDTACFGVAGDKSLQAAYVSTKRDDRKAIHELREKSIQAGRGNDAAAIGTAIHAMSERWEDPEDDFNPPEPYFSALSAYTAEMQRLGLESVLFEFPSVCLEYSTAGTADRLYRLTRSLVAPTGEIIPAGTHIIGDIKTSKTLEYSMGGFAAQMSLYAQGQLYDVVNECFYDNPLIVNQDWGLIAWIPSNQEAGHCEMIWVDLQAGNEAAWLASMVKEYRKKWRNAEPVRVPDPASVEDVLVAEFDAVPVVDWIKQRLSVIVKHAEAKDALITYWPEGIPTPRNGLSEQAHVERVLTLLDDIEAEFGFTFPEGDPRVQAPTTTRRR